MMAFGVDASVNYKSWGNTEAVSLTRVQKTGNETYTLDPVKGRAIQFKEMMPSGGVYTAQDRVFLLPKTVVDAATDSYRPKPADLITDSDGIVWTILEAPLQALKSTYRCICRDMILAADLRDTLTINRPTSVTTTDDAGGRVYTYAAAYSSIACRFQEVSADGSDERGGRMTRKRYSVPVGQRLYLTKEDQVIDQDGNIYELIGWHDPDRIDQLQILECERRWA